MNEPQHFIELKSGTAYGLKYEYANLYEWNLNDFRQFVNEVNNANKGYECTVIIVVQTQTPLRPTTRACAGPKGEI